MAGIIRSRWIWLLVWLTVMVVTVAVMSGIRRRSVSHFGQPDQNSAWQQWRDAAAKGGPVERRVPKSDEPPTLRLMRDHYAVSLIGILVFESAIVLFLGVLDPRFAKCAAARH